MSDHNNIEETEKFEEQNSIEKTERTSSIEAFEEKLNSSDSIDDNDMISPSEAKGAENESSDHNKDKPQVSPYDAMSLERLTIELENLIKNEKVQAIKTHVSTINSKFKTKLQNLLNEKKEDFLNNGGNEIDFYYNSPVQKRFKEAYKNYRTKLTEHYQSLEKNLKQNLIDKLEIIEDLKGLINLEENINTTYKLFKDLQERWRNTGPIPRDKYNNAWNSYHHHVELFYDFLHLNRDLRDLDFKHNLEKKLLIIERAEQLTKEDDVPRAFRELQELHKMWKEELGPVSTEHQENIWERFKTATKKINDKRQMYYREIDKIHEQNLEKKLAIIAKIEALDSYEFKSHTDLQTKIKDLEALRTSFFNAGKVPIKVNETTWSRFKEAVKKVNRKKNAFYKALKKEQYHNLQKKLELIQIAEDNKESDDFEITTPLMKNIQNEWKKIGHVPRKDSDSIWKRFKTACNFYFDRIHATRNVAQKKSVEAWTKKTELLHKLKEVTLEGNKEHDLTHIKNFVSQWSDIGSVPNDKSYIDNQFQKMIDSLLRGLKIEKNEIEIIKFGFKLDKLNNGSANNKELENEHHFVSKKINDIKSQINQLENNLEFFTNTNEDNPFVKEVHNNIKNHKESLELWEIKLQKIKKLYS